MSNQQLKTNPGSIASPYSEVQTTGLTKREYFAAVALQGLLAGMMKNSELSAENWAEMAVEQAEALVAVLND